MQSYFGDMFIHENLVFIACSIPDSSLVCLLNYLKLRLYLLQEHSFWMIYFEGIEEGTSLFYAESVFRSRVQAQWHILKY